jgi:macrodomain Ter protein organizer (MatP/YcbG family)
MPFKSQAQRRKFAELLVKGEISPETFEEWNRETGGKKLPERVKPKRRAARKTTGRARRKPTRKTTGKTTRKATRKAKRR